MRNGLVDVTRFFGALGIVWFHAGGASSWIGYSGLPLFLALGIYFTLDAAERHPPAEVALARFRRLLGPFVAWSAIFLLAKSANALVTGVPLSSELRPWMLLAGTSLHLWFLPFIFLTGTAIVAFGRAVPDAGLRGKVHLALAIAALVLYARLREAGLEHPFGEWVVSLPFVFLGAALHACRDRAAGRVAMVAVFILAVALLLPLEPAAAPRSMVLSALIVLACLSVYVPAGGLSSRLALLSYGIYLVHPLIISVAQRIPAAGPMEVALLSMAGATLAAMLLQNSPLRGIAS